MDWCSVSVDSSSNQEIYDILEQLKEIAPHINWRIKSYDYETGNGDLTYYSVIKVPEDQLQEAEEIIELWENGEDLSDYSPLDRYGELYINQDGERVLNPAVKRFQTLVWEYNKLLKSVRDREVEEAVKEIAKIVSTIYTSALDLPRYYVDSQSDEEEFNDSIFDERMLLDEKYNSCRDELEEIETNLSDIYGVLNISYESWYEYHYEGKSLVGELIPDGLAQMVHEWRFSLFAEYDWGLGNKCLDTLRLAQKVLQQLN